MWQKCINIFVKTNHTKRAFVANTRSSSENFSSPPSFTAGGLRVRELDPMLASKTHSLRLYKNVDPFLPHTKTFAVEFSSNLNTSKAVGQTLHDVELF